MRWLLLVVILLYILTGFGITEFRTVEAITFGLLTKQLAFRMHDYLFYPMLPLFFVHSILPVILRLIRRIRVRRPTPPVRVIRMIK